MFSTRVTFRWSLSIRPNSLFSRFNSTTAKQYVRQKPKMMDLIRTPTTKSLILTLITSSMIIELMNSKKNLETLINSYNLKFEILLEIIDKLNNNEKFDITKELQLANSFTENKYSSKTDIQMDEQLEQFLKEITQDEGENNQLQQIEVETQVPKDQSIPDIINENIKNSTQEKPKSYY